MRIKLNKIGLLQALYILIKCQELKPTMQAHIKGNNHIEEIKDDAYYCCVSAAEM